MSAAESFIVIGFRPYIQPLPDLRSSAQICGKMFFSVPTSVIRVHPSFTARYEFDTLVWYEEHSDFVSARTREVEIKGGGKRSCN